MTVQRELEKCQKAINGMDSLSTQSDDDLSVVSSLLVTVTWCEKLPGFVCTCMDDDPVPSRYWQWWRPFTVSIHTNLYVSQHALSPFSPFYCYRKMMLNWLKS